MNSAVNCAILKYLANVMTANISDEQRENIDFAMPMLADAFGVTLGAPEIAAAGVLTTVGGGVAAAAEEPAAVYDRDTAEAHKQAGNAAHAAGDLKLAEQEFTLAIESDPTFHIPYSNRCVVRRRLGKLDEAVADGKMATELAPEYARGHYFLAKAYEATGDKTAAAEAAANASRLDASNETYSTLVAELVPAESPAAGTAPSGLDSVLGSLMQNPMISGMVQNVMQNPEALQSMLSNPAVSSMMNNIMGNQQQ